MTEFVTFSPMDFNTFLLLLYFFAKDKKYYYTTLFIKYVFCYMKERQRYVF